MTRIQDTNLHEYLSALECAQRVALSGHVCAGCFNDYRCGVITKLRAVQRADKPVEFKSSTYAALFTIPEDWADLNFWFITDDIRKEVTRRFDARKQEDVPVYVYPRAWRTNGRGPWSNNFDILRRPGNTVQVLCDYEWLEEPNQHSAEAFEAWLEEQIEEYELDRNIIDLDEFRTFYVGILNGEIDVEP